MYISINTKVSCENRVGDCPELCPPRHQFSYHDDAGVGVILKCRLYLWLVNVDCKVVVLEDGWQYPLFCNISSSHLLLALFAIALEDINAIHSPELLPRRRPPNVDCAVSSIEYAEEGKLDRLMRSGRIDGQQINDAKDTSLPALAQG